MSVAPSTQEMEDRVDNFLDLKTWKKYEDDEALLNVLIVQSSQQNCQVEPQSIKMVTLFTKISLAFLQLQACPTS